MDLPFMKKKQQPQVMPGKGFAPIDRVREMASRGFSEPEMIDILRRDGFSADEVDKALTQALRIGVTGEQPQQAQQWQPVYQQQPQQQQQFQWPSQQQMPPVQQQQMQQPQQQPQAQQQWQPEPKKEHQGSMGGLPTLESLEIQQPQESMPQIPETSLPEGYYSQQYASEEYIDYLVQQRVAEVTDKVADFQKKYTDLQAKIEELNADLRTMSAKASPNQQGPMMAKMESFSETVSDVDNRLSGLEKAFKETLPALIDSVRALSDLVSKVRRDQQ